MSYNLIAGTKIGKSRYRIFSIAKNPHYFATFMRLIKCLLTYTLIIGLLLAISVGLLNTYMGVDSPVKEVAVYVNRYFPYAADATDWIAKTSPRSPATKLTTENTGGIAKSPVIQRLTAHEDPATFAFCLSPGGRAFDITPERTAYRWTNEDGVASFGDEKPKNGSSQPIQLDNGPRDFVLHITTDQGTLPLNFHGHVTAGARRIYDQWYEWLGASGVYQAEVMLQLVGDQTVFRQLWGSSDALPNGFYPVADNTVFIYYNPSVMSYDRLLALSFHEISHLITAWQVGRLPPWYTEGLAEYFETMTVTGQSATFRSQSYWRKRAEKNEILPISELVQVTRQLWMTKDVARRYASAGAMFAYLQSTDVGRQTLRDLAREASSKRCENQNDKGIAALSTYPGGIGSLNRRLKQWVTQ